MCEWEKGLRRRLETGDKAGRKEEEMVDGGGFQGTNQVEDGPSFQD